MANPMNKTAQKPRNDEQKRLIRDQLVTEIVGAIPVLMQKREEATYRQLAMTISAFTDTVQLLDGLPKGIQEIAPALNEIMECVEKLGWSRTDFFDSMLDELRLEIARKRLSGETELSTRPDQPHVSVGSRSDEGMGEARPPEADRATQGSSAAGDAP